jgi:hypothetical protein
MSAGKRVIGEATVVTLVEENAQQSGKGRPGVIARTPNPMFTKSIAELSDIADKLGVPLEALVATLRTMR